MSTLWFAAWRLIECAAKHLMDANLAVPATQDISIGGIDSLCTDGLLVDFGGGSVDTKSSGSVARLEETLDLIIVRSCVDRGITPAGTRQVPSAQPPDAVDPCFWTPPAGTFHGGQLGVYRDLRALMPAMALPNLRACDGDPFTIPTLTATRVVSYRTGAQGRAQGWRITYRVAAP